MAKQRKQRKSAIKENKLKDKRKNNKKNEDSDDEKIEIVVLSDDEDEMESKETDITQKVKSIKKAIRKKNKKNVQGKYKTVVKLSKKRVQYKDLYKEDNESRFLTINKNKTINEKYAINKSEINMKEVINKIYNLDINNPKIPQFLNIREREQILLYKFIISAFVFTDNKIVIIKGNEQSEKTKCVEKVIFKLNAEIEEVNGDSLFRTLFINTEDNTDFSNISKKIYDFIFIEKKPKTSYDKEVNHYFKHRKSFKNNLVDIKDKFIIIIIDYIYNLIIKYENEVCQLLKNATYKGSKLILILTINDNSLADDIGYNIQSLFNAQIITFKDNTSDINAVKNKTNNKQDVKKEIVTSVDKEI